MDTDSSRAAGRKERRAPALLSPRSRLGLVMAAPARGATLGGPLPPPLPLFPTSNWWNLDVSTAPVDPSSAAFVSWIGDITLHPDFGGNSGPVGIYGIPFCTVPGSQAKKAVTFQYWDESDGVDFATMQGVPFYPIPDEAITQIHWIEGGQAGNANVGGDRHMLIFDSDNRILYELYKLKWDTAAGKWRGGSGAAWDLTKNGRRPNAVDFGRRGGPRDPAGPGPLRRGLRAGRDRARVPLHAAATRTGTSIPPPTTRARTPRRRRWARACG